MVVLGASSSSKSKKKTTEWDIREGRTQRRREKRHARIRNSKNEDNEDGGAAKSLSRGAFILFEGVDRCGKTTQASKLVESLNQSG